MSHNNSGVVAVPPETLPGLELMGFICCKCGEVTLDEKLRMECFDSKCGHERCANTCQIFDRAGRLWERQSRVPISWACICGRAHSVVDSLVDGLATSICPCNTPAFLALYNTTGRRCKGLTISSPFTLNTADDVKKLLKYLERTPWGSCIQSEQEMSRSGSLWSILGTLEINSGKC